MESLLASWAESIAAKEDWHNLDHPLNGHYFICDGSIEVNSL